MWTTHLRLGHLPRQLQSRRGGARQPVEPWLGQRHRLQERSHSLVTNRLVKSTSRYAAPSRYCQSTATIVRGVYEFENLPAGVYYITASPPTGENLVKNAIGPITIANALVPRQDIILFRPNNYRPTLALVSTTSMTRACRSSPPTRRWIHDPGLSGGTASYQVIANGQTICSGPMAEGPAGSYAAEIAPLEGYGGYISVKFTVTCPNNTTSTGEFNVYIDPSGHVRTVQGAAIVGATVTLYKFDDATGQFVVVPNQSAIMSPNNRTNPDLTDATGHFGWDVVAGLYKVRASKYGCTAPYTGAAFVETEVMVIPPPVFDLDMRLICGDAANGWGETTWYFAEGYTGRASTSTSPSSTRTPPPPPWRSPSTSTAARRRRRTSPSRPTRAPPSPSTTRSVASGGQGGQRQGRQHQRGRRRRRAADVLHL